MPHLDDIDHHVSGTEYYGLRSPMATIALIITSAIQFFWVPNSLSSIQPYPDWKSLLDKRMQRDLA